MRYQGSSFSHVARLLPRTYVVATFVLRRVRIGREKYEDDAHRERDLHAVFCVVFEKWRDEEDGDERLHELENEV